jgi:NAD(P)H-hydrate repair Nnr-like enzyme with NAD(P)H-hydrate dehydratase domain
VLGSNVSAQYVGQVTGPVLAGMIAGLLGTQSVFVLSAAVTAAGLCSALLISHRLGA